MGHVTPMMEKFQNRRREERGTLLAYSHMLDGTQAEHAGLKIFVPNPAFYCTICGISSGPCGCAGGAVLSE